MAKFKIGDRVKLNHIEYPTLENRIGIIRAINPVVSITQTMTTYDVDYFTCKYLYVAEKWIELVEPETNNIKKAFERLMFDELYAKVALEELRNFAWVGSDTLKNQEVKNRIPDRVVFNQDKGKVTVLISKHLDGVAPYWAYTVKTSENDKYDAIFGFMLAYFKYINRSLEPKEQKAIIERVFKMPQTKRFPYLMGVVDQELLKLLGTTKKVEELNLAITSPNADMNYNNVTWDYAEWKEMLRVHELETKREYQKEINKQIKAHQLEIDKLKGDNNKK